MSHPLPEVPSYLMAYFLTEQRADGEQIRFAVSHPGDPTSWHPLAGGDPVLRSTVGEQGVRDPFLVRHPSTGRVYVIATDLRVHPDHDWLRATRYGSRSLVVWWSDDLVTWNGPTLTGVSDEEAGNTWAPKAFWSAERSAFLVVWASALYPPGRGTNGSRTQRSHQRLMSAWTSDFIAFTPAEVYFDPGHDVIDATFLEHGGTWYRFSVNSHGSTRDLGAGGHISLEVGTALLDSAFRLERPDIGFPELARGEGPAVFTDPDTGRWYLLIDEFGLSGYHLFRTDDLSTGQWERVADARLPSGARHGSVLQISAVERGALIAAFPL